MTKFISNLQKWEAPKIKYNKETLISSSKYKNIIINSEDIFYGLNKFEHKNKLSKLNFNKIINYSLLIEFLMVAAKFY